MQEIGIGRQIQPPLFLPNTRVCRNHGIWHNRHYYLQNASDDCRAYVSLMMRNSPKQNWLFVGDSTIRRLVIEYRKLHGSCYVAKRCGDNDCNLKEYLDLPYAEKSQFSTMIPAKSSDSLQNQMRPCKWFLYDSTGCANRVDICQNKKIEYLAVRWAVDEPEPTANSTKFSLLFNYLASDKKDICVLNIGMHYRNVTVNGHVSNVITFIGKFIPFCHRIIWLSVNSILGDKRYPQKNQRISERNDLVMNMIIDKYPDIGVIDMFQMSTLDIMHIDNVHLNVTYYDQAASFFLH